ncbi:MULTISPECIES: methyl-accepting chemotaxis protein [Rhodomicrobium]|uniref:methyl-accepting chemotaxis protein n=1 Tax=Rhodomicrobium TaxID=1068 RepID=UPI000B4BFB35|nr:MULTISPECIES: methyl-accepting chemotaxis protein [Rhodomicrobium]
MKNLSVRNRILGIFAGILAVLAIVGLIAFIELKNAEREVRAMQEDSLPGIASSANLANTLVVDYALTEAHIALSDPAEMQAKEVQLAANRILLETQARAYELTILQAEDRQIFEAYQRALATYFAAQDKVLRASRASRDEDARNLNISEFQPAFEQTRAAIHAILTYNLSSADAAVERIQSAVWTTLMAIGIGLLVALLLSTLGGYHLIRAVTKPLKALVVAIDAMRQGDFSRRVEVERNDEFGALATGFNRMVDEVTTLVGEVQKSGIQVSTSMTEMAATSKQQQATATEIAATTTEVGATSKEILATSRDLLRTIHEVAAVAEETAGLAVNGQAGVSSMEETMRQVTDAASTINAKLGVLNEKAGNINQVVTTITKVADQTNLLSLNAAIEAEKAGEYGRGFAVVATEIRRLADQTGVATYDIEQMIKEIQSAISASVMGMDKFSEEVRRGMSNVQQVGGQLSEIVRQVQALVPHFDLVSEGMQGQATGAEQISEALLQLTEAAQQTVDSLHQSTESINDLNQVTGNLRSSVSRFKLSA